MFVKSFMKVALQGSTDTLELFLGPSSPNKSADLSRDSSVLDSGLHKKMIDPRTR